MMRSSSLTLDSSRRARRRYGALCRALLMMSVVYGASFMLCAPGEVHAVEVRISGEARLSVDVQAAGTTLQIVGVLRDELGQPLPQADLMLTLKASISQRELYTGVLSTDMQGRFQFQRELGEGYVSVELVFDSTEHLKGQRYPHQVQLVKVPPRVDIQYPRVVMGRDEPAMLRVRASARSIGIKAPVEVTIDAQSVGTVELDHFGRGVFDLSPHLHPGENAISVVLPATEQRESAEDLGVVRYVDDAQLVTSLEQSYQRLDRGLRVFGRVSDEGVGLGSGHVTVRFERASLDVEEYADELAMPSYEEGKHTPVRTKVNERGEFEAFFSGHLVEDGVWRARVEYRPDVGASVENITLPMRIDRTGSKWLLNVLGVLGILFGVVVLSWRVSLIDFSALLRTLRGTKAPDDLLENFDQDEQIIVETMAPPDDTQTFTGRDIGGVVWDVWRQQPVPFAALTLTSAAHGARTARAMSDGRFRIDAIERGAWTLRVEASGFAPGTLEVEMPHAGELGYFRLGMVAIPLKIKRFYQVWVRRVQGRELWGVLSPRKIEEAIRGALGDPEIAWGTEESRDTVLSALTAYLDAHEMSASLDASELLRSITQIVEEAYFSAHHQDEALWHLLVSLTQRLDEALAQAEENHEAV